jgi:hypothetical protein
MELAGVFAVAEAEVLPDVRLPEVAPARAGALFDVRVEDVVLSGVLEPLPRKGIIA